MADMREEGVVSQWNDRGFGFIHFPDGRRAYVHNSQCGGNHLTQGETVTTVVLEDERNPGKLMCTEVQQVAGGAHAMYRQQDPMEALLAAARKAPRSQGQYGGSNGSLEAAQAVAAAAAAAGAVGGGRGVDLGFGFQGFDDSGRMEGTVTQWNERGFGFIEFSDGQRAYAHNSQCGGEHLQQGEMVTANVAEDERNPGKLQAIQIKRGRLGEDGTVTDWNEEKGFGFILLDDHRRVYIHRRLLTWGNPPGSGSLMVGQRLRVTVAPDARNPGKLCVLEVKSLDGEDVSRTSAQAGGFSGKGDGKGGGKGGGGYGYGSPQEGGPEDAIVAEWREQSGFGFLHTDDGRRLYCHRSMFGGEGSLTVGHRLHITSKPDSRNPGKWCVGQILSDPFTDALPTAPQQRSGGGNSYSESCYNARAMHGNAGHVGDQGGAFAGSGDAVDGTVDQWNEAGGFGFLMLDDGRRTYIHRSSLGKSRTGNGLMAGQRLLVTTKMDQRNPGKWCVDDVISVDGVILGEDAPDSKRMRVN